MPKGNKIKGAGRRLKNGKFSGAKSKGKAKK